MSARDEPLGREQIEAVVRRALGPDTGLLALEQFRGGSHTQVYRLSLAGRLPLILRVGPPAGAPPAWDEGDLLRRGAAMRPFFASIASLMPQVIYEDFSRELLDRDYRLQTFIEGQRWQDAAEPLEPGEASALWRAFGAILRQIHEVRGASFGDPPPGQAFGRWSAAVEQRFEQAAARLLALELRDDAALVQSVLALVGRRRTLLDEVTVPRLLHGDLWLFNLLVRETPEGARLVGVLEADRAWWGDPLADWTLFALGKSEDEQQAPWHASFWEGYGERDQSPRAAFRAGVYQALHIGAALARAAREQDEDTLARGRRELPEVLRRLADGP